MARFRRLLPSSHASVAPAGLSIGIQGPMPGNIQRLGL